MKSKEINSTKNSSKGGSEIPSLLDSEIIALREKIHLVSKICDEINPYAEMSEEMKDKLRSFGIYNFDNPFQITNTLVVILEDSIERLQHLNPTDPMFKE